MHKERDRLDMEPLPPSLLAVLATLDPADEEFAPIADPPPEPVEFARVADLPRENWLRDSP